MAVEASNLAAQSIKAGTNQNWTTSSPEKLPHGGWPVLLTPYDPDGNVDFLVLDSYVDWLLENDSAGLFAVALSGEMFELAEHERLAVSRRVVERVGGRVPVAAASPSIGNTEQAVGEVLRVAQTGVDIVVLVASTVLGPEDDEQILYDLVAEVLVQAPDLTLGIYECPVPYHRILSTGMIEKLALSGRVKFFKETSHDVEEMRNRVVVGAGKLQVYNAGIENYGESLLVGTSGLSGWIVNVAPDLVARLTDLVAAEGFSTRAQALQNTLMEIEQLMGPTYPNSAKLLVEHRTQIGFVPISRWRSSEVPQETLADLINLLEQAL